MFQTARDIFEKQMEVYMQDNYEGITILNFCKQFSGQLDENSFINNIRGC